MAIEEGCDVDDTVVDIKCPSFLSIYIASGYYGRVKGETLLCNGEKDSVMLTTDECMETGVAQTSRDTCRGEHNCSLPVSTSIKTWVAPCDRKQKNQLKLDYICGKYQYRNRC